MNKNRRIIKFEEFDFEAANNTGKFINKSLREKAEIDAMKSFTESEIKNAVTIVNRAFNKELTESVEDLIILENIFSGLYNSIKNNVKKLGDIRNAVSGKMGEIKQFLANLGITRKMSPDEVAIILNKKLGNLNLTNEAAEDAPKSLMTKIWSALGATSGLGGVLTYVITTIIGIGKGGNFQHGLGDTGAIVSAIALGIALLSGIAYAFSAHKDELAHKAKLRAEYAANNESKRNGKGKKINESRTEDLMSVRNSLSSFEDKIISDDEINDSERFITLSHNGNEVNIILSPEIMETVLTLLDYAIEDADLDDDFKPENTESSNLDDDYSDIESEPSNEEPNWNKFESLRNKRNNKRRK